MSFSSLSKLTSEIESADPHDSRTQAVIHERIVQLRNEMERAQAADLAAYLDSAACLTNYLVQIGGMTPEDVKLIVGRLVKKVEEAFENPGLDSGCLTTLASPEAELATISPEEVQRMIDNQVDQDLLGEIMLQLRLVKREDLERALVTQRATDMRIGEALVSIGACTWEQVKQGVAAQQQMRSRLKLH